MTIEQNAISLKNVSKKYHLYASQRDRLKELVLLFQKKYHREFWALQNINLEIPKGTTLGIVGRNGSGKSTLLQIICSIMHPSKGSVTVDGRISALLELGAGFNPEFSGRENILMNGVLMGFEAKEMEERMSAIENFAEIGEFIDQPMKKFSSGMFVRLAFSTAIHIDPDILMVDEVLTVGDAKFQNKCFKKIHEFQSSGKTILFVTHDAHAVLKHCDHAILLNEGSLLHYGTPKEVVNHYLDIIEGRGQGKTFSSSSSKDNVGVSIEPGFQPDLKSFLEMVPSEDQCVFRNSYNKGEFRQSSDRAEIIDYLVICDEREDPVRVQSGERIDIYVKTLFHQSVMSPVFGLAAKTQDGVVVYGFNTSFANVTLPPAAVSDVIVFKFSLRMNLNAGDYFLDLGVDERSSIEGTKSISRRCELIHLIVSEKDQFDGIANLETVFEEVCKQGNSRLKK